MERDILGLKIKNIYFMQPALLTGERKENRPEEKMAENAFKIINPILIGPLKKYRSIKAETVAKAMRSVALQGYKKASIPSVEIKGIAGEE